jgi:heat shock protein HslJ
VKSSIFLPTVFVEVVVGIALLAGCGSTHQDQTPSSAVPTTAASSASLVGTEWVLVDLAGTPALKQPPATLAFPEAGRAAGSGSCNRFTGSVTITGATLKFGPLASTRMACMANDVSQQEDRYFNALAAATRYEVKNGELLIYCDGFDKPLRFAKNAVSQ